MSSSRRARACTTPHAGSSPSRETADAIYLVQTDRSEVRLPRVEIASLNPGRQSIMPQGLIDVLTEEEVLDLLAYVRSAGDAKDPAFQKPTASAAK